MVVVPLTGFLCQHLGFRGTLRVGADATRAWILKSIREAIEQYVEGGVGTPAARAPAARAV
jgi:hypothetical protein